MTKSDQHSSLLQNGINYGYMRLFGLNFFPVFSIDFLNEFDVKNNFFLNGKTAGAKAES